MKNDEDGKEGGEERRRMGGGGLWAFSAIGSDLRVVCLALIDTCSSSAHVNQGQFEIRMHVIVNLSKQINGYTLQDISGMTTVNAILERKVPSPRNHRKNLPSRPPARLFTIPPPKALFANVDA